MRDNGYVFELRQLAEAEVEASLTDQAEELLSKGYHRAAAVLAGAVDDDDAKRLVEDAFALWGPRPRWRGWRTAPPPYAEFRIDIGARQRIRVTDAHPCAAHKHSPQSPNDRPAVRQRTSDKGTLSDVHRPRPRYPVPGRSAPAGKRRPRAGGRIRHPARTRHSIHATAASYTGRPRRHACAAPS